MERAKPQYPQQRGRTQAAYIDSFRQAVLASPAFAPCCRAPSQATHHNHVAVGRGKAIEVGSTGGNAPLHRASQGIQLHHRHPPWSTDKNRLPAGAAFDRGDLATAWIEPLALLDWPDDAVDARGPYGANRKALAKPIAVDELLDRRFVGTVVTGGPGGMSLVQRPVVENPLVDGAGGDENEPPNLGLSGCLDQLQSTEDILLGELQQVPLPAAKAAAGMI